MQKPAGMSEHRNDAVALDLGEGVEMIEPNVAVVDVAQHRLHLLNRFQGLVEPAGTYQMRNLQRISKPLGCDAHGMMTLAVFGIGQTALVFEQLVQLSSDVLLGSFARLGSLRGLGRRFRAGEDFSGRPSHFAQDTPRLKAVYRFHDSLL